MDVETKSELKLDRDTLPYFIIEKVIDECEIFAEEREPGKRIAHYIGLSDSMLPLMTEIRALLNDVINSEIERRLLSDNENNKDTKRESSKVEG